MRNIFALKIPLPYSKNSKILESCLKCEDSPCIESCPQNIIKKDNGIFLDFSANGCTFCKKCAIACENSGLGILDLDLGNRIRASVSIDEGKCLAWNKTLCFYCYEACESKSIDFSFNLYPKISESCTKCGICESVCPLSCIKFKGLK